ncbi:MAG: flagellar basal body rod protein FlgB [Oscillospiraceae bacterium]|jgi:flagellar basal-body rod protein FlgB|nr:flagellar basal body rod protein FlgB [Oscillospiraceae bacterium]
MYWLDNISTELLQKDLDGLWVRQRAISDNLANYETPGYKNKSVSFENQLRGLLSDAGSSSPAALADSIKNVKPVTTEEKDEQYRADGNGVDLEQQNLEMARTVLNYSYAAQAMTDSYSRLETAVTGNSK